MIASIAAPPNPAVVPSGVAHRLWFGNALPFLVAKLFTGRVRVTGCELVPKVGPILFVGRHRAGLMDGWLYAHALPRPTVFVIAARLRRQLLLRPLVAGIAVMRRRDGGRSNGGKPFGAAGVPGRTRTWANAIHLPRGHQQPRRTRFAAGAGCSPAGARRAGYGSGAGGDPLRQSSPGSARMSPSRSEHRNTWTRRRRSSRRKLIWPLSWVRSGTDRRAKRPASGPSPMPRYDGSPRSPGGDWRTTIPLS